MNHFYDSHSLWWSCFCVLFEAWLQNFSFCATWKKIVIQVWNNLSVTKWWQILGVNYLFNFLFCLFHSYTHTHTHTLSLSSSLSSSVLYIYMWFSVHHHHPICIFSVSNPYLCSTRVVVLVSSRYLTNLPSTPINPWFYRHPVAKERRWSNAAIMMWLAW